MRTILGILAIGSIVAIITVLSGGVDGFYELGAIATLPGSRALIAAFAVLGGSLLGLSSWGEAQVMTETGLVTQSVVRPWLVAAAVALAGLAAFLVFSESGDSPVFELGVGECFDDPGATDVRSVATIPCEESHDYEVFAVVQIGAISTPFPGQSVIDEEAAIRCYDRFRSYVGSPYETSVLDIATLSPTSESWSDGDREVTCAAYRLDGQKMSGSVQDSGL